MNLVFKSNLTSERKSKVNYSELSTTSTEGGFKLNSSATRKLGLSVGDHVGILEMENEVTKEDGSIEMQPVYVIFKGDADKGGVSKLVSPNGKASNNLSFSASAAWQTLNGSNEKIQSYEIGEVVETGHSVYPEVYPLTFVETRDKIVRERKNADGSVTTEEVNAGDDDEFGTVNGAEESAEEGGEANA
jgi:hypothetical protein